MAAYGLLTMYNLTASIGVSQGSDPPGTWTYAELAEGFDNIAEALNEVVQQYFFLSDKGFAKNHVTGMAPAFTLTGRRVVVLRHCRIPLRKCKHFCKEEIRTGYRPAVFFPAEVYRCSKQRGHYYL